MDAKEIERLAGKIISDTKRKRGSGRYPWEFLNVLATFWMNGEVRKTKPEDDKAKVPAVVIGPGGEAHDIENGPAEVRADLEADKEACGVFIGLMGLTIAPADVSDAVMARLFDFGLVDDSGEATDSADEVWAHWALSEKKPKGDANEEAKAIADKLSEAQRDALRAIFNDGGANAGKATVKALVDKGVIHQRVDENGHKALTDLGKAVCAILALQAV